MSPISTRHDQPELEGIEPRVRTQKSSSWPYIDRLFKT